MTNTILKPQFLEWLKTHSNPILEPPMILLDSSEFMPKAKGAWAPKTLFELRKKSGIYAWFCTETNKIYVGSASNLFRRGYKDHFLNSLSNCNLQGAIKQYGFDKFLFIIFKVCIPTETDLANRFYLTNIEQIYLDAFNEDVKFNITKQARSCKGRAHTEESKKKISAKLTGRLLSENTKKKSPLVN